uniref:ubiquitinyl hydrolase 1 n=1 Tax=Chromera velia CCMP2878 TaxID=1169474 RepID=A0A0G4FEC6_9ALVE|eukprot:Cvel_16571.t1-p1 / transcript=Cvel_16571.t1 / gene=Cvel_16571 / organism=Chromera_velia_CCMP2878 / gene_product=hypothetical protein / transcript_product=hypothetical protein / location=Cvel_scaffold1282:21315-27454(-) / protein_length=606 / sequence_SO=supercontig / SO=protein_coding / is_pseudo=false
MLQQSDLTRKDVESIDEERKIDLTNGVQLKLLHKAFKLNQAFINFFLTHCVFPKDTRQFPQSIVASACHLVSRGARGFSGTKDGHLLQPLTVKQLLENGDDELESTDGKMLSLLQQRCEGRKVSKLTPEGRGLDATALAVLQKVREEKCEALIDAEGLMAGICNQTVAERLSHILEAQGREGTREGICLRGVLFFSEVTKGWMVRHLDNGFACERHQSDLGDRECFAFFDQERCRGADLRLHPRARAVLTLGLRLRKEDLMQSAMRMRQLEWGQRIVLVAPPNVFAQGTPGALKALKGVKTPKDDDEDDEESFEEDDIPRGRGNGKGRLKKRPPESESENEDEKEEEPVRRRRKSARTGEKKKGEKEEEEGRDKEKKGKEEGRKERKEKKEKEEGGNKEKASQEEKREKGGAARNTGFERKLVKAFRTFAAKYDKRIKALKDGAEKGRKKGKAGDGEQKENETDASIDKVPLDRLCLLVGFVNRITLGDMTDEGPSYLWYWAAVICGLQSFDTVDKTPDELYERFWLRAGDLYSKAVGGTGWSKGSNVTAQRISPYKNLTFDLLGVPPTHPGRAKGSGQIKWEVTQTTGTKNPKIFTPLRNHPTLA